MTKFNGYLAPGSQYWALTASRAKGDAIINNVQIAVVDDELLIRDFVVDVMTYCVNRKVLAFESAKATIAHLEVGNPLDILLINTALPAYSGFELLKFAQEQYPSIYRIAMSANPADQTPAESLGAQVFLSKPFALRELFDIIQRYVVVAPDPEENPSPPPAADSQPIPPH